MEDTKYTYRFLARLIIEAETPLAVGSGNKDITTDSLVAKDVNGLPYIPGSAIAGVLRHIIGEKNAKIFFGYQNPNKKSDGKGSEIIFSEAKILNSKSEVIDGLKLDVFSDTLLKYYRELPVRQHVRMTARGTAADKGKFDNQICYAGTRFCFEIEMVANSDNTVNFDKVLNSLKDKTFRIGGGTRKGFGEITIIDLQTKILDLEHGDLDKYLTKNSDLNSDFWDKKSHCEQDKKLPDGWAETDIKIKAKDMFLFGSGFGDDEVDITPVKAAKVDWSTGIGVLKENLVLLPATSLKGALAHRTAYHWNRLNKIFIGGDLQKKASVEKSTNPAVKVLFGYEEKSEKDGKIVKIQKRGNIVFSDIIQEEINRENENTQVHVSIDRFTGGAKAKSGALFTEKNVYGENLNPFNIRILKHIDGIKKAASDVEKQLPEDLRVNFLETVNKAFDAALDDLRNGMLPLGGGSSRGNGVFVELD